MAQLDMNKIGKGTGNSAEIEELKTAEQAKADEQPAELTGNALEKAEDTNETKQQTQPETKDEGTGKVVVTYVGGGIWRDKEKKLWASEDKSANILSSRQYTEKEYEDRDDIHFMVKYGSMKATHVK